MLVKLLGAFMLTGGGFFFGISVVTGIKQRERELVELEQSMELLCSMLEQFSLPTEELACYLSQHAPKAGAQLFKRLLSLIQAYPENRFYDLWALALTHTETEAQTALLDFGRIFGSVGVREQCEAARRCRGTLRYLAKQQRDRRKQNGRLYVALAAAFGALLSIVML